MSGTPSETFCRLLFALLTAASLTEGWIEPFMLSFKEHFQEKPRQAKQYNVKETPLHSLLSLLLNCSHEPPYGELHPALETSAWERHGHVGRDPEEGHKNAHL